MDWLETEKGRKYHETSSLFPMMEGDEFEAFKVDIRENGLVEPIWLHPNGSILDGRNRHRACIETGTRPRFRTWDGQGSLVGFVVSLNLHRRHLNETQRAVVASKIANMRQGERTDIEPFANLQKVSQAEAAKMLNVSPRTVATVAEIKRESPDLVPAMEAGKLTAHAAQKEARKRNRESSPVAIASPSTKAPRLIVGQAEDMHQIGSETVDLIITSPRYNLGSDEWPMGGRGRQPRENGIGYTDATPEQVYQQWQIACLLEMYRVAKPGASLFYNHKVRQKEGTIIHPLDWLRDAGNPWTIRQEIIWDRGSTHNHSPTLFWPEDERIYWMTKGKPVLPERPVGMSTVWRFHGPVAGTWHPAPFVEELPRRCIQSVGRDGITVLDPFAGSCTTLRVALEYGYDVIGVDVSREYLEQAARENGWTGIREI